MPPTTSIDLIIQVAIFLKLYPLFCLTILLRAKKRIFLLSVALILGVSLLYLLANVREISLVFYNTPKAYNLSYGINVLLRRLERSPYFEYTPAALVLTRITAAIVMIFGVWLASRVDLSQSNQEAYYLDAFRAGCAIYVGTFLLGNNFDYRLTFLLLTFPQLVSWWQERQALTRRVAKITGVALYLSLWHRLILRSLEWLLPADFPGRFTRALALFPDEIANWVLFAGMMFLFAASLPRWIYLQAENASEVT